MALLTGSAARNAAVGSTVATDQRGFPTFGTADIGAYEAQLGPFPDAATLEDTASASLNFIAGTVGTLSASPGTATFGGNRVNRTLQVKPPANVNGPVAVTVTDSLSHETQTFTLTVTAVNDAPSFTKGPDQTVNEDAGPQTVPDWATTISAGPLDEAAQTLTFLVSNNNAALFSAPPAISPTGTLTYTPAPNASGTATVTVQLKDNGGTANGGADTSAAQTFNITVNAAGGPVNFASITQNDSGIFKLRFATQAGRSYRLEQADSPDGPWVGTGLAAIAGDGSVRTFEIPPPANITARFFRLLVTP